MKIKRCIWITSDIIGAFCLLCMAAFNLSGFLPSRHKSGNGADAFILAFCAVLLTSAFLLAVDALCLISEKHSRKLRDIERSVRVLPLIEIVLAVTAIPVCLAALFYAPMIAVSLFSAMIVKALNLTEKSIRISSENIHGSVGIVYIVSDVLLEISVFIDLCRIIVEKEHTFSEREKIKNE